MALPSSLRPDDPPQFTGGVTLVHLDVQVNDAGGSAATGLTQSDFRVFDNGDERPIVAFAAYEQPLDLVLLFDTSGSMHDSVQHVAQIGPGALAALRPGDRVAVMNFATSPHVFDPFTDNLGSTVGALRRLQKVRFFGGTRIDDAVYEAANLFFGLRDGRDSRRRAILIFTDNGGGGRRTTESAIENLQEADATLSGLLTETQLPGPFANLPARVHLHGGIERAVKATGGEMLVATDIEAMFPEMIQRLRRRYSLYYGLPEGAGDSERSVRVELSSGAQRRRPGCVVLARAAYRPGAQGQHGFAARN
jgi:VWFA-related protein